MPLFVRTTARSAAAAAFAFLLLPMSPRVAHAQTSGEAVRVDTLLPQMADLAWLAHRPVPYFTLAQSSSYDRRTTGLPGGDPFANGDAGNYVRIEPASEGHATPEYVMADLKGPGAVVRVWSANPTGTIRFYFDGEAQPRLSAKMTDLLTGKYPGLGSPFSYEASRGTNLYFPLPYARSLKITVGDAPERALRSLYYHVGYRTYDPGTPVRTFQVDDIAANAATMAQLATRLTTPDSPLSGPDEGTRTKTEGIVSPGKSVTHRIESRAPGEVRELIVRVPALAERLPAETAWEDPRQPHNRLRSLLLKIDVDGESTVLAPLGNFFGTAAGLSPYQTYPMSAGADGTLTCRFVQPYNKRLTVTVIGTPGAAPTLVTIATLTSPSAMPTGSTPYLFHAAWTVERTRTRPMRDMHFLEAHGEGMLAGVVVHIANPVPDWWGEGDEKISVDGDTFPRIFGTGSEDYFGYAWSSPQLFQRPYHAQPRCDGPGTRGHTTVMRWDILDPVTYRNSLKFDMELWHWADVEVTYDRTLYWYSRAGDGPSPAPINMALLALPYITPIQPVAGAIEGEDLALVSRDGGTLLVQEGFWQLSDGKQRWWVQPTPGQKLVLRVPVKTAGRYEIFGNFCHAVDYGIHKLRLNGQPLNNGAPIDFFHTGAPNWVKQSLGTIDLPAGDVLLEVECVGHNPAAKPGNMFGLDYLLLEKR